MDFRVSGVNLFYLGRLDGKIRNNDIWLMRLFYMLFRCILDVVLISDKSFKHGLMW